MDRAVFARAQEVKEALDAVIDRLATPITITLSYSQWLDIRVALDLSTDKQGEALEALLFKGCLAGLDPTPEPYYPGECDECTYHFASREDWLEHSCAVQPS